jgi:hypothetical protein
MGAGSSIGNFTASVIYTADPCATKPLYSSSCSGYGAALAKQLSASSATDHRYYNTLIATTTVASYN